MWWLLTCDYDLNRCSVPKLFLATISDQHSKIVFFHLQMMGKQTYHHDIVKFNCSTTSTNFQQSLFFLDRHLRGPKQFHCKLSSSDIFKSWLSAREQVSKWPKLQMVHNYGDTGLSRPTSICWFWHWDYVWYCNGKFI